MEEKKYQPDYESEGNELYRIVKDKKGGSEFESTLGAIAESHVGGTYINFMNQKVKETKDRNDYTAIVNIFIQGYLLGTYVGEKVGFDKGYKVAQSKQKNNKCIDEELNYLFESRLNVNKETVYSITSGQLMSFLKNAAELVANERKCQEETNSQRLSQKEVCDYLGVSKATLWRWEKIGYLKPDGHIGSKPYYSKTTIDSLK